VGELRVAGGWRRDGELRVIDGEGAELALILDDDKAVLTAVTKGEALDGRLWACSLQAVPAGDAVASLTGRALLRARLVLAAALCGIAGAATDMAVAYAGMREQFGRPIGAFQAVKHHCANMALAARSALDLVTFAAVAVDNDREDAAFQTEAALLLAIEAALKNARTNIQVHGGMGFSDEADAHLLVKRAHGLAAIAGGGEAAAARLGPLPGAMRA
jgi:alkylation response protein AidB-like acyl-CoA dehydrogenase